MFSHWWVVRAGDGGPQERKVRPILQYLRQGLVCASTLLPTCPLPFSPLWQQPLPKQFDTCCSATTTQLSKTRLPFAAISYLFLGKQKSFIYRCSSCCWSSYSWIHNVHMQSLGWKLLQTLKS